MVQSFGYSDYFAKIKMTSGYNERALGLTRALKGPT